jgi:hypothetical protein
MGLLDFGAVADSGINGPYADYDTALTALRADASASDGDVYQLNNGLVYLANVSGAKILLPPDLHSQGWTHHTNATGSAYFTSSDALADVSGRGWDVTDNEVGASVTKSAGSALVMTGGSSSNYARVKFTPTANAQTSTLAIVKASSTATSILHVNGFIQSGNYWINFSLSPGSANHAVWRKSGSASGEGILDHSGNYFAMLLRAGDADATSEIFGFEGAMSSSSSRSVVDRATLNTGASTAFAFFVGSNAVLNITECHIMVPT